MGCCDGNQKKQKGAGNKPRERKVTGEIIEQDPPEGSKGSGGNGDVSNPQA
jgi:hypothetical protein